MTVLFAEDDTELCRQVISYLTESGHHAECTQDGRQALKRVQEKVFDVVILDVGLPKLNGIEVVEQLRAGGHIVPVLFLTARDGVTDRVRGLRAGGDDYMVKPFAMEELMARLEALHRRSAKAPSERTLGRWTLDPTLRRLKDGSTSLELQPREWTLLEVFMKHPGRILTKSFLLEKAWDIQFDPGTNVVDAMVCRLRRKIDEPGEASRIQTIRGQGYVFKSVP